MRCDKTGIYAIRTTVVNTNISCGHFIVSDRHTSAVFYVNSATTDTSTKQFSQKCNDKYEKISVKRQAVIGCEIFVVFFFGRYPECCMYLKNCSLFFTYLN